MTGQLEIALQQVEENANDEWLETAFAVVEFLAQTGRTFTSDDVWELMAHKDVTTHEPRAMGAVLRKAAKLKLIHPTGGYVKTRRAVAHSRAIAQWKGTN